MVKCSPFTDTQSVLMELVKAVAGRGVGSPRSLAIVADKKHYSYDQLVLSARKISDLLCNADLKIVSRCPQYISAYILK